MKILALLDKPSTKSFGMVAFVYEDAAGQIHVSGLAQESQHRVEGLTHDGLDQLVKAAIARRVTAKTKRDTPYTNECALWIGESFLLAAIDLSLVPQVKFNLAELHPVHEDGNGGSGKTVGQFAIVASDVAFQHLDAWTERAWERVNAALASDRRRVIAELMQWVLPTDARTVRAKEMAK